MNGNLEADRWRVKSVHEPAEEGDGLRVLIEPAWPEDVDRYEARVDVHERRLAPSAPLITWLNEDPRRFRDFARAYLTELRESGAAEEFVARTASHPVVTLLVAATEVQYSAGPVARAYLSCLPVFTLGRRTQVRRKADVEPVRQRSRIRGLSPS